MKRDDPETHYAIGQGLMVLNRADRAAEEFRRAIGLKPDYVEAYIQLGRALRAQGRQQESITHLRQAVSLQPDNAEALFYLGVALQEDNRIHDAALCYHRAAALDPGNARLHSLAVEELLRTWDQEEWPVFRASMTRLIYNERHFDQPQWLGAPLNGRTLVVYCEQGLGDNIQFVRYLPMIQAAAKGRVIVAAYPELRCLFERCDGVDEVIEYRRGTDPITTPFDMRIGLMHLPLVFQTRLPTIPAETPYLHVEQDTVERRRAQIACYPGLKVGIRWAGSPSNPMDARRSCRLSDFLPLASIPNIKLFSLQKDQAAGQISALSPSMSLIDLGSEFADLAEAAAAMQSLDLIITVDTSLAHLAGALGRPVWLLLCSEPDSRWQWSATSTPWYPSMRIFRQQCPGDWESVFTDVARALHLFACGKLETDPERGKEHAL